MPIEPGYVLRLCWHRAEEGSGSAMKEQRAPNVRGPGARPYKLCGDVRVPTGRPHPPCLAPPSGLTVSESATS